MHASEDVPEALPWWEILTVAKFSHYSSLGCANLTLRVWATRLTMSAKTKCNADGILIPPLLYLIGGECLAGLQCVPNLINLDDKIHTETSEAGWQVITLPHDMWLVVWFSECWTFCCNCHWMSLNASRSGSGSKKCTWTYFRIRYLAAVVSAKCSSLLYL